MAIGELLGYVSSFIVDMGLGSVLPAAAVIALCAAAIRWLFDR